MKLISVVMPPERLELAKERLAEVQVFRMTAEDVQGVTAGATEKRLSSEEPFDAVPMVKLEIAVNENFVTPTLSALAQACGDVRGKIFVMPLEDVIRIRTGERGPEAV
ncbi:MAG: P-II family nitrogen regulator [Planctomycetota bacterium]